MAVQITAPIVLAVEGEDDKCLFEALIASLGVSNIQTHPVGGRDKFGIGLRALVKVSGWRNVQTLGIVRDADSDPRAAFKSICSALDAAELAIPSQTSELAGDAPRVAIMLLPGEGRTGMLEDLCLESVHDDPAMVCVEGYFDCLRGRMKELPQNPAKARVRAFLSSREYLEQAHFERIQSVLGGMPDRPNDLSIPKIHAFLASRYKPDLRCGIAAEEGYWLFEHRAFDGVRRFLDMLQPKSDL